MLVLILFQEKAESALRAHSSSVRVSESKEKIPADDLPKSKNTQTQAFLKEEVLTSIHNVRINFYHLNLENPLSYNELGLYCLLFLQGVFPCSPERFFSTLLSDGSGYTSAFVARRKDSNLVVSRKLTRVAFFFFFFGNL